MQIPKITIPFDKLDRHLYLIILLPASEAAWGYPTVSSS